MKIDSLDPAAAVVAAAAGDILASAAVEDIPASAAEDIRLVPDTEEEGRSRHIDLDRGTLPVLRRTGYSRDTVLVPPRSRSSSLPASRDRNPASDLRTVGCARIVVRIRRSPSLVDLRNAAMPGQSVSLISGGRSIIRWSRKDGTSGTGRALTMYSFACPC